MILNPVIACLSGGRNKMVAAKAYELFNAHLDGSGLTIHTPETIRDVSFNELPLWVARFGGQEFVIMLPDVDEPGAHHVAERIRKTVELLSRKGGGSA